MKGIRLVLGIASSISLRDLIGVFFAPDKVSNTGNKPVGCTDKVVNETSSARIPNKYSLPQK